LIKNIDDILALKSHTKQVCISILVSLREYFSNYICKCFFSWHPCLL